MNSSARILIAVIVVFACSVAKGEARHLDEKSLDLTFLKELFDEWKLIHNAKYLNFVDELVGMTNFGKNYLVVDKMNREEKNGAKFWMGPYSDMSSERFNKQIANSKPSQIQRFFESMDVAEVNSSVKAPPSFDWRSSNSVTPVKDQKSCGSCWAFCTNAVIESLKTIKDKKGSLFSEQQLVDCDTESNGCKGGWPTSAVNSIIKKGGLNYQSSYPYENGPGPCRFQSKNVGTKVARNVGLKSKDENNAANYIATYAPIWVAINAGKKFQYYKSGILSATDEECSQKPKDVNHAVCIVGYGEQNGEKFFTIKNSWGTNWGEKGYMRIKRGVNTCGLANYMGGIELA